MYDFSEIQSLDAVKQVQPLNELLSIVAAGMYLPHQYSALLISLGDLAAFEAWDPKKNADVLAKHNISADALLQKLRLKTLASLCAESSELDFAKVAQVLHVSVDDIETWVINGACCMCLCACGVMCCAVIRAGLVEAKIDEVNSRILVRCVTTCMQLSCLIASHRSRTTLPTFGPAQWQGLKVRTWSVCCVESRLLQAQLEAWQASLADVQRVLGTVTGATQVE